jgi:transcriptional regulator with XRE-family HTH domain
MVLTHGRMLTPAQLRAARALLDWSREDLAAKSGIAAETVKGFELRGTDPKLSTLNAWRRALEVGGVVFIDPNPMGGDERGPGVRLRGTKGKR